MLGDANVGKSSIINRFVYEQFNKSRKNTVGAEQHAKNYFLTHSNKDIKYMLWDVAG